MERFIPVENFRKKGDTFRGISFFSLLPECPKISVPFVHSYSARLFTVTLPSKGGEIRDTKTFNLSRNIVSLQVFVDVSRFSPCVINLTRNKNICCRLKKCGALIG